MSLSFSKARKDSFLSSTDIIAGLSYWNSESDLLSYLEFDFRDDMNTNFWKNLMEALQVGIICEAEWR